jgi:hypothetical protein
MALTGKTISQLDHLTSPLTGNEAFPIEYNGATYHISQSQIISGLATTGSNIFQGSQIISGSKSLILGDKSISSGSSNIVNAQSDLIPFSSASISRIIFNYPTSSTGYSTGISEDRRTIYKYLTGSYGVGLPAPVSIPLASTNSMDFTYRFAAYEYGITDYKFVLNNSDIVTYIGNSSFSTASLISTGSFATSSYISGAAVMSYSLSEPLPAQIGILGSEITHITFAISASIPYTNLGTASLNKYWEGFIDDSTYIRVPTPFPINFLGRKYNYIYVSDNGYIQFDALSSTTFTVQTLLISSSRPPFPNIKVGAADLSMYKVYTGSLDSNSETFRLWIQGRSEYPFGTPNREYSFIFYKESERIDLYVDSMVFTTAVRDGYLSKVSQISDGYTLFSDFSSSIYSGSGYALNIWNPPVTSSTIAVKQISGNTITAYGSASIFPNLINSTLYYINFDKRTSTGSQCSLASYSLRNTSSLQNTTISSINYNPGTNDTTIILSSTLQSDYTASIYSSSYINLETNNFLDVSVNTISQSVVKINNPESSLCRFSAYPLTASSITLYKNDGYTKNLILDSVNDRKALRITSSSYSIDSATGSLFLSYSIFPLGDYQSVAYGEYSQVHGLGVVASSSYQYVYGKYNELNDTTSTFVVAGGSETLKRKNLFSVNNNGIKVSGDILYATESLLISKRGSTFSSSIALTGYLSVISADSASYLKGSGSAILKVAGYYSNHLNVRDDGFSGLYSSSIFSVNDLMGLPVLDTFFDGCVRMYNYPDIVFEKSGSSIYLGTNYLTESKAVIRNNFTIDKGLEVQYNMTQATGSTTGSVTSSIYTYYFNPTVSSSMYYSALINGYDTGSRELIVGDIKSTIKYTAGTASIVGTNIKSAISESAGLNFNIVAGGTSASLEVYGILGKTYKWAATITTQNF